VSAICLLTVITIAGNPVDGPAIREHKLQLETGRQCFEIGKQMCNALYSNNIAAQSVAWTYGYHYNCPSSRYAVIIRWFGEMEP